MKTTIIILKMKIRSIILSVILLMTMQNYAQITGKFGTYYDQRELLFETMTASENDIIFLGNSITDGSEWSELFQNPNCKNRGISGDIVPGVLNRLETVTKGHPAMIFLMIGTNDMNHGASNDSIARAVRAVVQRIKSETPSSRLIVQSILPTNDCFGLFSGHTKRWQDVAVINAMLKTMTQEEGVEYLDLYKYFANEEGKMDPKYSNDGLHLNGNGYLLWKEIVESEIGRLPEPVRKSKVPIWLNLSVGGNIADCYDKGTMPFNYLGVGGNLGLGITVEWRRYHFQNDNRLFGNMLENGGTDINIDSKIEFLYRFYDSKRNRLHLWVGGALQTNYDVKEIPELMNASSGISAFVNLCAEGMLSYDFAFIRGGSHNLLTAYGKLTLPLVGLVIRPGYAYIDNYTSNIEVSNTVLESYENLGKFFLGVGTDIGLTFNLINGNRIGVSYRWDYLTTGQKGIYRFDNALHSINLNFMFNIN